MRTSPSTEQDTPLTTADPTALVGTDHTLTLLRVGAFVAERTTRVLRPLELTPTGFAALSRLADWSLHPHLLAGVIGLSPSGVTRVLDTLERRGLVSREADDRDRRRRRVSLTESGRTVLDDARSLLADAGPWPDGAIDDGEGLRMMVLVRRLADELEADRVIEE